MELLLADTLRAVQPIQNIIRCFLNLFNAFFVESPFASSIINLIMNNSYLLISVSLLLIGFVIALVKRIISI